MKHEPLNNSRKCAVCGKSFIVHPGAGWLYKKKTNSKTTWYCSYKCMRQAEKVEAFGKKVSDEERAYLDGTLDCYAEAEEE